MSSYVSKYAVCPFYRRHNDNRICCEGTDKTNTINLVFEDSKQLKEYAERHCDNIQGHKRCLVCRALNSKYPT